MSPIVDLCPAFTTIFSFRISYNWGELVNVSNAPSQMTHIKHDEIDLIEMIRILWRGKWTVCLFTLISFSIGAVHTAVRTPAYESRINVAINLNSPFQSQSKSLQEFELKFQSRAVFEDWKEGHPDTTLHFDNVSSIENVNGYLFTRDLDTQLIQNIRLDDASSSLASNSNDLSTLNEVFRYANFVNRKLSSTHHQRAKEETSNIKKKYKDYMSSNEQIIVYLLTLERFNAALEDGTRLYTIYPPTLPKMTSQNSYLIYLISMMLGAIAGILFVFVSYLFHANRNQLNSQ